MSLWEDCIYWPAAGFSSEVRAGVDPLKTSPARKCRARGRIEQALLDEGGSAPTDLRPSPATPPYQKKWQMFLSTIKGRDSLHTGISGTFLRNRAKSVGV